MEFIGLLFILPLFFYNPINILYGNFKALVLDVGQGLSIVIFTHKKVIIYDINRDSIKSIKYLCKKLNVIVISARA